MTIVMLGPAWPYRGGIAAFNDTLAQTLTNKNTSVTIYNFSLQYPAILFPGKTQYSDAPQGNDIPNLRKLNSINPFNWIKIGNDIRKLNPDILIIHYWIPFMAPAFATIGGIVKKNKHTKIVSVVSNILPHERKFYDTAFTKYFVKKIDCFITMAASVTDITKSFAPNKPVLQLYHPVYDHFGTAVSKQTACNALGIDADYNYILFFGIIRKYKGLDILLQAFSDVRLQAFNLKLIIAGEFYDAENEYRALINNLHLVDKVLVHNRYIPDGEVVNYFCAADIVVQPYKHATQSGVTQIAYHFEKPMLVTNVGGLPEMVAHNRAGYVVNADAHEISNALVDFYTLNKKAAFEIAVGEEKKKFGWDNFAENIIKLAESI